ncbi:MAG: chemotaxis protein CheB [Bacteroidetes bacterium]|jgi:two-component system, chemotaxis family, protein-glutamate methylesterase/glutaminase|nr:chemotaxis protein CheB [Bacteroidota bacterium]MBT6687143.1 chemotaxis protein CheB [Bacteroidota bacterium]MBT7144916.1 chemotaxis protein CheB [Bacteroidota bacterium]MBT7492165.1 chemotaxis protein CheB [Bacteroidota bacterium]
MKKKRKYEAIVIGVSAGGMAALNTIMPALPKNFSIPILIVQHISPRSENYLVHILNNSCKLKVKEADEKEKIENGKVYLAPPNYHFLVEEDFTISLSTEERVNYARPSINVLFESAAIAYKNSLIGVILTGANNDGSQGLKSIKDYGGYVIVQNPKTAEVESMPKAALKATKTNNVFELEKIAEILISLSQMSK